MARFQYRAIAAGGKIIEGVQEVADEAALIALLRRQGSILMRAEAEGKAKRAWLSINLLPGGGLRKQEVTNITGELAAMLAAGQDLDRALLFAAEIAPNRRVALILRKLRDSLRDGNSFADSLAAVPNSFSRLYIGLIRAGEAGGALAQTLARLTELLERERALAATVTSALIYPAVLLLAAAGSIILLLTHVLPQFVPMFEQSGAALPWSTQMMIDAGHLISQWGLPFLVVAGAAGLLAQRMLRQPKLRLSFDRLRLHLPLLGPLAREIMAARLTRTLGTLLLNGMPLINALDILREVLGNTAGVAALDAASQGARQGGGLARPLAQSGLFPKRTIHLLQLGEETAQLGAMALRAAELHEERVRLTVQRMVSLLTPMITIGMGGIVALIVGSVMQAMLGLNTLAQ
ncbi:type II secretion system F family protein [Acidisoma cellulosilytica]|uniref:Type II secretion system F family protein n=1 Tax=Acidisoma cellulosilyticum TaxID=2802395 RepID=A0A963Z6X2_9PROT|nr:type II secretion system F family protein [Acidisoma cellulosilyticum]MCB8883205.1 type II secretion system F family protein [Acidisoma cellulosilyticum]